ncbi:hypothetical protein A1O3_08913 [Capronia epimyces CBS 606.96]|uniref:Amidase domain-containing protein n=1 Tax=Capronia epimyces CBS 606.96 TaxID=1182542 RepID=W9XR28_9EURO|nr:uncharacterized protein A1O3_08913 [Capronia epimyces CBS 606.96]EXJ79411.1 hypothetical protein A1O3_08913 [Capronia epimyces CBS 606.96]
MVSWEETGSNFRAALQAKIPPEWQLSGVSKEAEKPRNILPLFHRCGLLTERELEITEIEDATALLAKVHSGSWTALEVVSAFCKRAVMAQQLVNCLMDIDVEGAMQRARELDAHFASTGSPVGPLHGLPISLKDLTKARGFHHSFGITAWAGREDDEDAVVVQILREAGAVFYVKTTMPQTGMALETVSNVWGTTLNPFNTDLCAGGSSGGEGALGACRGAPLGVATDIGGSIRAPASFNGLYALRPTSTRFSYAGNIVAVGGQIAISATVGPVGHSIRDLELFCRVSSDFRPWLHDPAVVPKPWIPVEAPRKTSIGVMWWDEVVMPHPPILRAMKSAVEKLKLAGHEVVEFKPYRHQHAWDITFPLYFPTGGQEMREFLASSGEPMIPSVSKFLESAKCLSVPELMHYQREQKAYRNEYFKHWNATATQTSSGRPVDAILMPSMASAAFPHHHLPWWGYLSTWNLLDYPSVVIPVTQVKPDDIKDAAYQPVNERDADNYDLYDPVLFDQAPVSLQLVGRILEEEQLLAVAIAVDRAIKTEWT